MDIGAIVSGLIEGAITLGDYLASLPEKDREAVKAQLRASAATLATDIATLDGELAKTRAALDALPPAPEPVK